MDNYDTDGLLASSGDEAISMVSASQPATASLNLDKHASGQNMVNLPPVADAQDSENGINAIQSAQRTGKRTATSPQTNKEKKSRYDGNLRLLVCRESTIDQDFMDYLLGELAKLQDLIPDNAEQAKFVGFGFVGGNLWIEVPKK